MIKNDVRRDVGVDAGPVTSGFKVDISRGERIGRVSAEWFSRPDDERYLSLSTLLLRSVPSFPRARCHARNRPCDGRVPRTGERPALGHCCTSVRW